MVLISGILFLIFKSCHKFVHSKQICLCGFLFDYVNSLNISNILYYNSSICVPWVTNSIFCFSTLTICRMWAILSLAISLLGLTWQNNTGWSALRAFIYFLTVLEIQDQGISGLVSAQAFFPWLVGGHLLIESLHGLSSVCKHPGYLFSFSWEDTSQIGSGPILMASFYLTTSLKVTSLYNYLPIYFWI